MRNVAVRTACYDLGMHEALWVVVIVAGVCGLLFVLDLVGLLGLLFSSRDKDE